MLGRARIVRIIRRLVEPPLEDESGRGNPLDAVIDGVTALATMQEGIH